MTTIQLLQGDCLEVMATLPANSVHSIVTDPPYGLSFMGKNWDHGVPGVPFWEAALRVAKPGAMLLAFGGTRTHHRLMCAIEDAGWEIRDCLMWLYGSGFPKSLDIGKAIDKHLGAEQVEIGTKRSGFGKRNGVKDSEGGIFSNSLPEELKRIPVTAPATDAAKQWDGWGTSLKPAYEPIILAMKPLDKNFANNALVHGVAGLNVDGCRINGAPPSVPQPVFNSPTGRTYGFKTGEGRNGEMSHAQGRWPSNVLLSEEAAALLDEMSGERKSGAISEHHQRHTDGGNGLTHGYMRGAVGPLREASTGGASRFFYCAKASKRDRDEGLEGMPERTELIGAAGHKINPMTGKPVVDLPRANHHPTVKPTQLMRYLVRLVTPPGGTVLDPFMGSGSTGKAAMLEGFSFVGIELDAEYLAIAEKRIAHAQLPLLELA